MTEHEHFDKEDFRVRTAARSYEDCLFTGCLFSSADLRDCEFTDCRFERCDLSMALLENTSMRTVRFHECKLLGTSFENCNQILFSPDFERCLLDYASFRRAKLRKRLFCGCSLRQADFSAADLSGAVFADCDLGRSDFRSHRVGKDRFLDRAELFDRPGDEPNTPGSILDRRSSGLARSIRYRYFRNMRAINRTIALSLRTKQNTPETMSVILKLRMLSDEDDCFLRDYEVPYESTLEELHDFICNDLQYEKIPESSFFEADREWNRRREYTHADAGATGSDSSASRCRMSENRLSDILHRMHDRLIFRFDPPGDRAYYLEVIDTAEAGAGKSYPNLLLANGEAPDQFDPEASPRNRSIFEEAMGDYNDFEGDDAYGDDE